MNRKRTVEREYRQKNYQRICKIKENIALILNINGTLHGKSYNNYKNSE